MEIIYVIVYMESIYEWNLYVYAVCYVSGIGGMCCMYIVYVIVHMESIYVWNLYIYGFTYQLKLVCVAC